MKNSPEYNNWYDSERTVQQRVNNRKKTRERQARLRATIIEAKNKACSDCGIYYPHYVMDFDHVRGVKLFTIAGIGQTKPLKTLQAEIAKCDIVCSNCHRERTHRRVKFGKVVE